MTSGQLSFEGSVRLEGGERHRHAARRLREAFPGIEWRAGGPGPAIVLHEDPTLPEGAFRIEPQPAARSPGHRWRTLLGRHLRRSRSSSPGAAAIPIASSCQPRPSRRHRAWPIARSGHGTTPPTGSCPRSVTRRSASSTPTASRRAGSSQDYRRCVDFCSRNRIAAIVIYGFLRDPHGGIEAAQELCRYATERGVRILPGIAIGSYGGCYWEGEHRYNLATWLKANPEHAATLEKGVGFQIADLAFPLELPALGLHPLGLPLRARDHGLDGGGRGLAGRDVRPGRHQHRGRRLRRLRLRALRRAASQRRRRRHAGSMTTGTPGRTPTWPTTSRACTARPRP